MSRSGLKLDTVTDNFTLRPRQPDNSSSEEKLSWSEYKSVTVYNFKGVKLLSIDALLCYWPSLVPRPAPVRLHESRHRAWYLKSRVRGPG